MKTIVITILVMALGSIAPRISYGQDPNDLRIYISVDLEGISGVGTDTMADSSGGKDYELARKLATEEVNAVVHAVRQFGRAEIIVNDSHGDHQNLLITELEDSVTYIQGDNKPLGMVQGLDSSFDAAIFLGYHARAGAKGAFLAHTGSGKVQNVTLNGIDVGEIGLNAAYAGAMQVPVVLIAGDKATIEEAATLFDARGVITKDAVTQLSASLRPPAQVREALTSATLDALRNLDTFEPWTIGNPVKLELSYVNPIYADIASGIPGAQRTSGRAISFTAENIQSAYPLARILYKFIDI